MTQPQPAIAADASLALTRIANAETAANEIIRISRISCATAGREIALRAPRTGTYGFAIALRDTGACQLDCNGRRRQLAPAGAGRLLAMDIGTPLAATVVAPFDILYIHLLDRTASGGAPPASARSGRWLRLPDPDATDATLFHLAMSASSVAGDSGWHASALASQLALAIHAHLVTRYADAPARAVVRLPAWKVRRVQAVVESRIPERITVEELARHCGLSTSHFARSFTQTVGIPPIHWIAMRRIERAKSLLLESGTSLGDVATACGFANQSHFGRAFAALEGMPPAAWRRRRFGYARPPCTQSAPVTHVH